MDTESSESFVAILDSEPQAQRDAAVGRFGEKGKKGGPDVGVLVLVFFGGLELDRRTSLGL